MGTKAWAMIVGINDYPAAAGQAALSGAVADAADFADWALHCNGGQVAPERMFFWTHPAPANPSTALAAYLARPAPTPWWDLDNPGAGADFDRPPRVGNVLETILGAGRAATTAAMADPSDTDLRRCYVFFAGHGVQTNVTGALADTQTCFVLGDFRPTTTTVMGLIPCEDLKRALLTCGFDEVFMFLDCCRVSVNKLNQPAPVIGSPNTRLPPAPLWGVGNASQKDKAAFETASAPIRGAFSKTLLEGLRTVRDPDTNVLTLDSLKAYVRDNIGSHTDKDQRPNFLAEPSDPPPIVLTGPPIPAPEIMAPIRVKFGKLAKGARVQLVDHNGAPIGEPLVVGARTKRISAVIGRFYSLDVVGAEISRAFRHQDPGGTDVAF